ncbi:MAG: glycosyltransferase family 2 protein [Sphaerochaeta sp.]|nr:glycosyltransferase family 2 protein [Sphaerochaeta sp.]
MSILYASLILIVGLWATILSLSNRRVMEKLKRPADLSGNPLVSIAIPARNEEHFIQACVSSLINQSYENIEILILDDNSTDNTAKEVRLLQSQEPRVRIIKGKPLKKGWRGKLYAMQQLYEESKGEYILYTDADTVHNPKSVEYGLGILINEQASMVSGYPKQIGKSQWVQTLVSAMLFNTVLYMPLRLQHKRQWTPFAMAIGQYLFLSRKVLDDIDGFTSISSVICDDVMLARACTRTGHKYIFADMKDALSCKMFSTFKGGFEGLERSITGVINIKTYMLPLLALAVIVLIAGALAPLATVGMFIALLVNPALSPLPFILTLVGSLLLFGSWTATGLYHGFPLKVAIQGPVAFVFVVAMYLHGYYRKASGKGFMWKGRKIS